MAFIPASTAVLEFQQASADGDFGLRCLDNSTVTITGQPRTPSKPVTKCKLTADVVSSSIVTGGTNLNGAYSTSVAIEASGNSILASAFTDNATSGGHGVSFPSAPAITNTTQTATAWLARGSGTNNRYVRLMMGNNTTSTSVTNGFYSDIDLQAGTAGTVTAIGNGTATSVSITAVGIGYLVRMSGKVSSGSSNTFIHFNACAVAGTLSYVGNTTQCFIADHFASVTTASISDTTFNVDTDTGWLNGDAVCVASTTRTASECEIYPLNANAGSSSFTSALYPFSGNVISTHSGTSPTQAEIGLLTRNVKIRSTSNTLMSYVYCTALSTVTASWAEFYYFGANVANKRGIEVDGGAVCNPKSITYCSIHDCDTNGFYCNANGVTSLNVTFSNNVFWNSISGNALSINGAVTNTDWTFDSNLVMRTVGNGAFSLSDIGGTFTNNTMTSCTTNGIELIEPNVTLGTFNNNVAHSNNSNGLTTSNTNIYGITGTFNNFTAWRNNGAGMLLANNPMPAFVFNNLILFGNNSGGIRITQITETITITGNSIIAGDTTFATQYGFSIENLPALTFNLSNLDMSGTTGIFAPHTVNDFRLAGTPAIMTIRVNANNCKFGATAGITTKTNWYPFSYMSFEKYNQTAGDHRTEMTFGQLRTDTSVFYTAAPSMRMTPNTVGSKLESAPLSKGILVAVNSGSTAIVSVWIRKDSSYTGAQPRLIVRANAAIGINADTVLTALTSTGTLPTMWDASTAASVNLTGSNLIATNTGTTSGNQGACIAAAGGKTSGKYYFEVAFTTLAATGISINTAMGVKNENGVYSSLGSSSTNGAIFNQNGNAQQSGSGFGNNLGQCASGDVIGIAVDLTNYRIWFRKSPSGNWNGLAIGSGNPATNVGGGAIPAGTITPFVCFGGSSGVAGNVMTANFGATTFVGAVPSGFTSGWPTSFTGPGTQTWEQLSGTTIAATDAGAMEFIVDCDGASGFINVDDWTASTS